LEKNCTGCILRVALPHSASHRYISGRAGWAAKYRQPIQPGTTAGRHRQCCERKGSSPEIGVRQLTSTSLDLAIVSSPWAVLDHNDPDGSSGEVPNTFVVEAVITNTGTTTATGVSVLLDYNEDPTHGWTLQMGEYPLRTVSQLAPGNVYHAYWLANYSIEFGAGHQYTISVNSENAASVLSSDNAYGNPAPGQTVRTSEYRSNAVSSVSQVSVETFVGVLFTVTVDHELGNTTPRFAIFGPVGNADFDPGSMRLIASTVWLYDVDETTEQRIDDRLYFPTLPDWTERATATYTFLALTPSVERVCSYAGVGLSNDVYDQFYCDASHDTIVPITSTLSLSLTKEVDRVFAQQNEVLTYTVRYTNTSGVTLSYVWIWDEINRDVGSIITSTIVPPAHPNTTDDSRVAWYLDDVQADESGTLRFSVLLDGNGTDLEDGRLVENTSHYGINQDSLPLESAASDTVTTVIQAPTITVAKTDTLSAVEPGQALTYSLRITNSGSIPASGLLISDVLPAGVTYAAGAATPDETDRIGQLLIWENLGPIPPSGGVIAVTLPVSVDSPAENGVILTDTLRVRYTNQADHSYATGVAMDTTTIAAPDLSISKRDYPDPVFVGQMITYTIFYTNTGAAAAPNVVITDAVPISTTYASCRGGLTCNEDGGTVSWSIGSVPDGASGNVGFSVGLGDSLATGDVIWNEFYSVVSDYSHVLLGVPISTTASREPAYIDGWTFLDANGDGARNPGEDIVPGVAITLSSATLVTNTTTDIAGHFVFRLEYQGPVSVTSQIPLDHFRTNPGTVHLDSQFGVTRTVDFGFAPTGAGFGVVFGTVFEDTNRDGDHSIGENGISGVTVAAAAAFTPTVTTNGLGQYTLRFYGSGAADVTETDPASYVSTTPNEVTANVVVDSSGQSPIDFGDFMGVKITGNVFDDVNVNGINDDGLPVAGATVSAGDAAYATDNTGVYTLYVAADPSPIVIAELDPAGYVSTNAVPGEGMTRQDSGTLVITSSVAGSIYSGGSFGDVLASAVITVSGTVWDDNGAGGGLLANGLREGEEPDLAGAVIELSSGMTQTTATDGQFVLYAPAGQAITINELNPDGYVSTNALPGTAATKLTADSLGLPALGPGATSAGHQFGDVGAESIAVITGTAFYDINQNGMRDPSEIGLSGITMTLSFPEGHAIAILTDINGSYRFAVTPGSAVRITSSGRGGDYYPTTLESVILRPPAAGLYPNMDFGYNNYAASAVLFGIVFDDLNGDGDQDFGEPGLSGAHLALNDAVLVTTSGNGLITGTFSISVTEAGVWTLSEANPAGYRSTTPDELNLQVDLGQGYYLEFGDTADPSTAAIYGIVFDDQDADGVQDADEVGLSGVVISATIRGSVMTATTQAYGQYGYGFLSADSGLHTITERDPAVPGYRSTTPDRVVLNVMLGQSYIVSFGDTPAQNPLSNIMGTVFNDSSGDGVRNPGEAGLENVLLTLSDGRSETTDIAGRYTFVVSETGFMRVSERDPSGYHSTTPNTITLLVEPSERYTVDFGDTNRTAGSSVYGTVFQDGNANGWWDLTEGGLGSVTVTLSGSPEASITNEWGQYTFLVGSAGFYTITESDLPRYVSTNAIPGNAAGLKLDDNRLRVSVALGSDTGNNLFGDARATEVITISGAVWEDNGDGGGIPGDGEWNGAEPGIAGARVTLSSGLAQLTANDGSFSLYAPPGVAITVVETNPSGYASTNAIPGTDATKVDNDTLRVADTLIGGESSTGNLFGDIIFLGDRYLFLPVIVEGFASERR
jgi:uncharacterized repeat protein (TIGR01451 family)